MSDGTNSNKVTGFPRTHDPQAKKNTDKARFFKGDWRAAHPQEYRTAKQKEKEKNDHGHTGTHEHLRRQE